MVLVWSVVPLLALANLALAQNYDFDSYNLNEETYPYRRPTRYRSPRPNYGRDRFYPKLYQPEDLFPEGFQPQNPKAYMPGNMWNMPAAPGRFRMGAESITDELKNSDDAVFVKKTSGSNPPPLPFGMDNFQSGSSRSSTSRMIDSDADEEMRKRMNRPDGNKRNPKTGSPNKSVPPVRQGEYVMDPESRRTFSLIAQLLGGQGSGEFDIERQRQLEMEQEMQTKRYRDRLSDMRLQASLNQIRSQGEMDSLRTEMRNSRHYDRDVDHYDRNYEYDQYDIDRELQLQREIDRRTSESRIDQMEQDLKTQNMEDDIYNQQMMKTKLTITKPQVTTKTRLRIHYPTFG